MNMMNFKSAYSVEIELPVSWGEMDAFGHVNNIIYFRYFENARIAYFRQAQIEIDSTTKIGPILASTQCQFLLPIVYPDTIFVGAKVERCQNSSFIMSYGIFSSALQDVVARGEGIIVSYSYQEKRKVPLPEPWRLRIGEIENAQLGAN